MGQDRLSFVLAGNPNSGKTTLFNALTGSRQWVANYPGVTVEKRIGSLSAEYGGIEIVDLPGAYSLSTHSLDEQVARDYILQEKPDLLINVIDASNLSRNLYLTMQLLELGVPMIIALNMSDVAEQRGIQIDAKQLEAELKVPVVEIVASQKKGVKNLICVARETAAGKVAVAPFAFSYGAKVDEYLENLQKNIPAGNHPFDEHIPSRWWAIKCLEEDPQVLGMAQRDGATGLNISAVLHQCLTDAKQEKSPSPARLIAAARYNFVDSICRKIVQRSEDSSRQWLDALDRIAIHPLSGWVVMVLVFFGAYTFTFSVANGEILSWAGIAGSPVGWIEGFFGWLGNVTSAALPDGVLESLLVNGIIGGVGGVLVFVPIIFLMFFVISLIDDSGYMARLAYLLDAPLRMFGLQGKSALAMAVSGGVAGGCAVPGIMATRTLGDPRERLATILVCPFLNCGAKLPVYAMLIAAFFQKWEGLMMLALTIISWGFALGGAWLLRRMIIQGESPPMMMELPPYHLPTLQGALWQAWGRVQLYMRKAATFILAASIVIWVMMSFPRLPQQQAAQYGNDPGALAQAELAHSAAGRIGKALEPVFSPLGFEWRTNIALLGGVAAKEVIVSTLGTAYSLADVSEEESGSLSQRLAGDSHWTPLKAFCLILFVMLYAPCVGTIAAIIQETRSWKWGLFSTIYSTAFAWIVAFVVFQGGRLIGLGG